MFGMPAYGGYGGYGSGSLGPEFFLGILLFTGVIFFIAMALGIAMYVLRSVALYKLAERRGLSNPGLAWIPAVGLYRAGTVADDINAQAGSRTYFGRMILGGYIFSSVVSNTVGIYYLNSVLSYVREWSYWGPPDEWYGAPYSILGRFFPIGNLFNSIAGLVGLAAYVLLVISLHRIFKAYRPQSATAWTVLSAIPFTAFLQAFFLFAIRNAEPVPEWRGPMYYPPGPQPPPPYGPACPPQWQPGPPEQGPPQGPGYPGQ
jgi:hypothetical protein